MQRISSCDRITLKMSSESSASGLLNGWARSAKGVSVGSHDIWSMIAHI